VTVLAAGDLSQVEEIVLPRSLFACVASHVVRKLTGHYIDGETPETKAFGMLAGAPAGDALAVRAVFPLLANMRHDRARRQEMDEVVDAFAIPSQTPNEQRGWIADPRELMAVEQACDDTGWVVFGNYHTHRVAWDHDPLRDTCTGLDRALAAESGQWTFVYSAVDLHRPRLRAFFEGDNAHEAPIRLVPHDNASRG
jgi:hypothetical protein